MFGIDSSELLLIAIVALVVIGPKELPGLLRTWGKWMAQMRGMASEFRGHVDEMVRQSELDEVKKQLTVASGLDLQSLDPTKEIRSHIQEGMAEGEKAIAEGKGMFDNPLVEPEIGAADRRPKRPLRRRDARRNGGRARAGDVGDAACRDGRGGARTAARIAARAAGRAGAGKARQGRRRIGAK